MQLRLVIGWVQLLQKIQLNCYERVYTCIYVNSPSRVYISIDPRPLVYMQNSHKDVLLCVQDFLLFNYTKLHAVHIHVHVHVYTRTCNYYTCIYTLMPCVLTLYC